MYNLRYHIASLVAVFLALAMGLLLGTIVVDRGVLDEQRATLIRDLQEDFDEIRAESAQVRASNEKLTAFADDTLPGLVGSVLSTRTVLVITSPQNGDTAGIASRHIRAAGGVVAVATFDAIDFGLTDEDVAAAAAKSLDIPTGSVTTSMVVTALAREWSTPGDARLVTKALERAGALKMTGLASTAGVAGTVLTCSFDGKPDGAALLLAVALTEAGRPAVGVESTERADGSAAAAHEAGLSGVDDIDTQMGQVSLTWVLGGRARGLFGQGEGVEGPYPSPLFGEE